YLEVLNILPVATYTCDQRGIITFFNQSAANFWNHPPQLGKDRWQDVLKISKRDGSQIPLDELPMALTISEGKSIVGDEILLENPKGKLVHVVPHTKPLFNSNGEIIG